MTLTHEPAIANIAVALSGAGRTFENLVASENRTGCYRVAAVIASNRSCAGFRRALDQGLPVFVADFSTMETESDSAKELFARLEHHDIKLIALAGFLKKFPCPMQWRDRIVNIHPSRLPKFGGQGMYGMRVHQAVLDAKEKATGASVHFVDDQYDSGRVIAQSVIAVKEGDTKEILAQRVFDSECRLYPDVIREILSGRLPRADGAVAQFDGESLS